MGLKDRDYMREEPDEGAAQRYDEERLHTEYGEIGAERKAILRGIIIAFGVLLLLFVLAAIFF